MFNVLVFQTELAEKLAEFKYADYSTLSTLESVLKSCSLQPEQPFPKANPHIFSNFLMKELNMI